MIYTYKYVAINPGIANFVYTGGLFGAQPANEYCFTLLNPNVIFSAGFDLKYVHIYVHFKHNIATNVATIVNC